MTTEQIKALENVVDYLYEEEKDYTVYQEMDKGNQYHHIQEDVLILKQMLEQVKKEQK